MVSFQHCIAVCTCPDKVVFVPEWCLCPARLVLMVGVYGLIMVRGLALFVVVGVLY